MGMSIVGQSSTQRTFCRHQAQRFKKQRKNILLKVANQDSESDPEVVEGSCENDNPSEAAAPIGSHNDSLNADATCQGDAGRLVSLDAQVNMATVSVCDSTNLTPAALQKLPPTQSKIFLENIVHPICDDPLPGEFQLCSCSWSICHGHFGCIQQASPIERIGPITLLNAQNLRSDLITFQGNHWDHSM